MWVSLPELIFHLASMQTNREVLRDQLPFAVYSLVGLKEPGTTGVGPASQQMGG